MRVERVASAQLRGLTAGREEVSAEVAAIVKAVRERGDEALRELVERFDGVDGPLAASDADIDQALAALDPAVQAGLEVAIRNVRTVAEAGLADDRHVLLPEGHRVTLREQPVRRAGIYAPGGRNPYPSTVVMGVVTARAAGVEEIVVCAPGAHPVILAACALCGADRVLRMGGAHAVAALAYGTETVPRVDVIAGPGGLYVQEAKRLVSGDVGIDMFAGPSDLLVVASEDADPDLVLADLVAQAEHGPGTVVALVAPEDLAATVEAQLRDAPDTGAVAGIVVGEQPLAAIEAFAPEHLQLIGSAAEDLAPLVRSAGCVLVGRESGTAFSDYVAGSNHTLPTGGAARFASGLNVRHFRRRVSEVRIGPAAGALAQAGGPVAEAEGFVRHAESMRKRLNPES